MKLNKVDIIKLQSNVYRDYLGDEWEINFPLGIVFRGYENNPISQSMPITYTTLNPLQAAEYSEKIACLDPNVSNTADLNSIPFSYDDGNDLILKVENFAINLAQSSSEFDSAFIELDTGVMDGPELILFEPEKAKIIGHLEINWEDQSISII